MEHKEYKHIVPQAKAAVLCIHGIAGSPNHFADFLSMIPEHMSVWNLLLDGHGKGVRDFSKASMSKWEAQVTTAVEELAVSHERIYILAHSMGTLFAIEQAIRNRKICKLFLLAVPLKLFLKPAMVDNSLKLYTGKFKPDDPIATVHLRCNSIQHSKNIFLYLGWIPRFLELFVKISEVRKLLPELTTKTMVFQSAKDEMVSRGAAKLLSENPNLHVTMLAESGHFYYDSKDAAKMKNAFQNWLNS